MNRVLFSLDLKFVGKKVENEIEGVNFACRGHRRLEFTPFRSSFLRRRWGNISVDGNT